MKDFNAINSKKIFLLIFLLSLLIRLSFSFFSNSFNNNPVEDSADYLELLRNLSNNGSFYIYNDLLGSNLFTARDPGLVFFLYIFSLGNASQAFSILLLNLISSLTVLLTGLTVSKITGNNLLGFLSAIFLCVYPPSIFFASRILTETLAAFFIVLSLYIYVCNKNLTSFYPFLIGILCGFLLLTRANLQGFFMVFIAHLFLKFLQNRIKLKDFLRYSILILVGFSIVLSPWIVRNYSIYDELVITNSRLGYGLYLTNNSPDSHLVQIGSYKRFDLNEDEIKSLSQMNEIEMNNYYLEKFSNEIEGNLNLYPSILLNRAKNFLHFKPNPTRDQVTYTDIISLLFWLPLLITFLASFRFIKLDISQIMLLSISYGVITILPFWGTPRFRYPFDPVLVIAGFTFLAKLVKEKKA